MEIVKENNLYILHFARIIPRFLRIPKEKKFFSFIFFQRLYFVYKLHSKSLMSRRFCLFNPNPHSLHDSRNILFLLERIITYHEGLIDKFDYVIKDLSSSVGFLPGRCIERQT